TRPRPQPPARRGRAPTRGPSRPGGSEATAARSRTDPRAPPLVGGDSRPVGATRPWQGRPATRSRPGTWTCPDGTWPGSWSRPGPLSQIVARTRPTARSDQVATRYMDVSGRDLAWFLVATRFVE